MPKTQTALSRIWLMLALLTVLALLAIALATAPSPAKAGRSFVPDVALFVDNVQFPDKPQWVVKWTDPNGNDHFGFPGPAERRPSGANGTISFEQNEAVLGFRYSLSDGRVSEGTGCYLRAAPMTGSVTDGVVNPWGSEIQGRRYCTDADFRNPPRLSGSGSIAFSKGEAVVGYKIVVGGREFRDCYMASAPDNGQVTDGVVNPPPGDVANKRNC